MLLSNILWVSNIMTPVPSVIIGNISYDSFQCVSATSCTTDVDHHDRDSCQPQSLKDYKTVAIINIVLIIIIGGLGNLLTIVSICLCRLRYLHGHKYNSICLFYLVYLGIRRNTIISGTAQRCSCSTYPLETFSIVFSDSRCSFLSILTGFCHIQSHFAGKTNKKLKTLTSFM